MDIKGSRFFYDLCRLCLEKPGFKYICLELCKDILWCTGVKVSPTENLPKKICFKCLDVISSAKKLKEIATKNDTYLTTLFEQTDDFHEQISGTNENILFSSLIKTESSADEETLTQMDDEHMSDALDDDPIKIAKLNVRKDLFESQSVTSTTIKESSSHTSVKKDEEEVKFKRIEVGQNVYVFECKVCNKRFDKWKKYYLHQRSHNKTIVCPLDACEKKFATKGDLDKHVRTHTGDKPYKCNNCSKKFAQRGTLKAHMDSVHTCQKMENEY